MKSHAQGRNKLQDNWHQTPYRIVRRFENNLCGFHLTDGSDAVMICHLKRHL